MPQFTAHTTALDATHLNALAVAAGYAQTTYTPTTSGLVVTLPAATYVIPSGTGTALSVIVASSGVTVPASSTTYIDVTSGGSYTTTAGAVASTSLRLLKIVSGGSTVTTVVQMAPVNMPFAVTSIAADPADYAQGTDTSGYTYTLAYSLTTIRTSVTTVSNAHASLVTTVTNFIAQKAAASGLASLNGSSLVVQEPASKAQASGIASLNSSSKVVQDPASKGSANGVAGLDGNGNVAQAITSTYTHVVSVGGTAPTVTAHAGTGNTGVSVRAGDSDRRGIITFTTPASGGSLAGGLQLDVAFASAYATEPVIRAGTQGTAAADFYVANATTAGFQITSGALAASTTWRVSYIIEG